MKKIFTGTFLILIFGAVLNAQTISDVSKRSADYSAVKKVVKDGYLSLYSGNKFYAGRAASRRELAIAIDKLVHKIDTQGMNLKKSEVQELVNLAKTFKKYLVNYEIKNKVVKKQLTGLKNEQVTIHDDMSRVADKVENLKKENQDQFLYIIGACILAALGILM
ncbi:S-layer homology domain-containing protein [Candidatus Margulisiibacteriota bacterium]